VHHRALNLAFREVSRLLVRLVMLRPYGALRRRHLPGDPRSFLEAAHDAAALVLVPLVWGVEPPRALPPNWQPIPPVLPGPARPLPPDLQRWIDEHCGNDSGGGDGNGPRGLVLVAFGTQATLSETAAQKMARAMSELSDEFCFVWKIDPATADEILGSIGDGGSDRILAVPWVPQNDVLGHPRTAAFVSHAGYGSLYEAAYHGVPVVAVPQFGDQPDNAVRPVLGGWGSALFDKEGFGAAELAAAVRLAPSLRPRAREVSALVRRDGSGPERAADWIEYAAEHGVGHLVPLRSIKASYVAYYNLDAALLLLLLALGAAAGMRSCVRSCRSSRRGGASSGSRGKEKRS
jgi:UDP:flavonoid glycosyltransferase YjiC (YdhE family)